MDLLCGKPPEKRRPGDRPGERPPTNHPDGAKWLTILNEAGFLGRYLPDWGRIVGQMQFDTYHIFTVDEHTIEAVKRIPVARMMLETDAPFLYPRTRDSAEYGPGKWTGFTSDVPIELNSTP